MQEQSIQEHTLQEYVMLKRSLSERSARSSAVSYDSFRSEQHIVREYDIALLEDNPDNHFRRIQGEKWDEFVSSIREYGVVSPLIIRAKAGQSGRYEILAGHNRRSGAEAAGLKTVPCIALDVDDVNASVLIGITNRQREGVSDLEWGWTYRTTLEAVKQQRSGRRSPPRHPAAGGAFPDGTSLSIQSDDCNGPSEPSPAEIPTPSGVRSIDLVARKYGVDRKTVQRKIRLTYLIPQLYELGEKMNYPQKMMIELSYLPQVIQMNVVQAVVIEDVVLTETIAAALRSAAESSALTINDVLRICREHGSTADDRKHTRAVRYEVSEEFFPPDLPAKQRPDYIAAALSYIRTHQIELEIY